MRSRTSTTRTARAALADYLNAVRQTPAQFVAFLMAFWLTSNGPVGLIISPTFSMHPMQSRSIELLGFIPVTVNGWHAVFHLITGAIGLVLVRSRTGAIAYALSIAVTYLVVAELGLAGGVSVCGMLAVDTFGNWVHVAEAVVMLATGALAVRNNARNQPRQTNTLTERAASR